MRAAKKSVLRHYIALLFILLITETSGAQERQFYRYKDNNGVTVIGSHIPSQQIKKGYEVITQSGNVVKTIEPALSQDDKEALEHTKKIQQQQDEQDQTLLRLYSHIDDIEEAKKRKLLQNSNDLSIVRRNIEKIESEIHHYQGLAANEERAGNSVSASTLTRIQELKNDRQHQLDIEDKKQQERTKIEAHFARDIARFKIIHTN